MALNGVKKETVLITGEGRLTFSIAACLLQSGYPVVLCTENKHEAKKNMAVHYTSLLRYTSQSFNSKQLDITDTLDAELNYKLVVAVTREDLSEKIWLVRELERKLPAASVIALNTESIQL